jgi:hypothetical protein
VCSICFIFYISNHLTSKDSQDIKTIDNDLAAKPKTDIVQDKTRILENNKLVIRIYSDSDCREDEGLKYDVTSGYSEWHCDECFDFCQKKFFPLKLDKDIQGNAKSVKIIQASSSSERVELLGQCAGTWKYDNPTVLQTITMNDGCVNVDNSVVHVRFADRISLLQNSKRKQQEDPIEVKIKEEAKPAKQLPHNRASFVVVYNVESSEYFGWQVQTNYYAFLKSNKKSEGAYLRLLTSSEPDDIAEKIPTAVVRRHPESRNYSPINKPDSIDQWLNFPKKPIPEVDHVETVVVIDPDNWIVKDLRPYADRVSEGKPIAQAAWYFGSREVDEIWRIVCEENCDRAKTDHVAVPIFIHRNDLKKIAPLWTHYTLKVRNLMSTDEGFRKKYGHTQVTGWSVEMVGYVYAAAHVGVYHVIEHHLQIRDVEPRVSADRADRIPMIHMGRAWFPNNYEPGKQWWHTEGKDFASFGAQVWCKCNFTAGDILPWPIPQGLDFVSHHTLTLLHEARESFGKLPASKYRMPGAHSWHVPYP